MRKPKILSIFLVTTITFGMLAGITGCSFKDSFDGTKNEKKTVESDSLWFDYKSTEISFENEDAYYNANLMDIVSYDGGYVLQMFAYNFTNMDTILINVNNDGEVISETKVDNSLVGLDKEYECGIAGLNSSYGDVTALVRGFSFDEQTFMSKEDYVLYNVTDGVNIDIDSIKYANSMESTLTDACLVESGFLVGFYSTLSDDSFWTIDLTYVKDGSVVKKIELDKVFDKVGSIDSVRYQYTDGSVDYYNCSGDEDFIFSVDTTNFNVKKEDVAVDSNDGFSYVDSNGKRYEITKDGVICDNEIVMPSGSTYVDLVKLAGGKILSATGDKIVILNREYIDTRTKSVIYVFDKANTNPNGGKTIVSVGCYDKSYNPVIAEAVTSFNETNDKYFVSLEYFNTDGDTDKTNIIANELLVDILGGEAPDVIVDGYVFPQLSDEKYLYDLSEVISSDLKDVNVFENVINAQSVGGKLYQLPLCFSVKGIFADGKDVTGEKGFAFDEFDKYLYGPCNGENPIDYETRMDIFNECLIAMSGEFYDKDGNVSFKNDAFYGLSEFCMNSIPEKAPINEDDDSFSYDGENYNRVDVVKKVGYETLDGVFEFISAGITKNEDLGFYGIPSNDGKGPAIKINSSIAISKATSDYEGSKELIEYIFKSEKQHEIWTNAPANSIIIDEVITKSQSDIDVMNTNYWNFVTNESVDDVNSWGYYQCSYEDIDRYLDVLKSADNCAEMDTDILMIVDEEIQAYFAGQKSIEDVASVIENRAQTIINER